MNLALELWRAAGWTMLHFLWLGAIVGLLASVMRTAVRRAPPWLRYGCALFWFGSLATTPLVIGAVVLQSSKFQPSTIAPPQFVAPAELSEMATMGPLPQALDFQFRQEPLDRLSRQSGANEASGAAASEATIGWPVGPQHWLAAMQPLAEWICGWLPWVWLCGSPLVMCLLMSGVVGADRLRRDAELLVSHPIGARCRRCARSLGMRRRVLVGVSERIAAPLLLGILRPMILLPPAVIGECSAEQIEMILWHELAHVRRWDNLVNLIQRLVEALLFFHPVVWRVSAWVRLEREHCCDAVVLRHVAEPLSYAETLAALAMPELSPRLATASLSNHQLVSRIRHILNLEDRAMRVSHKLALVLSVGIITGGVITYSMAQQATNPLLQPAAAESQPAEVVEFTTQFQNTTGQTLFGASAAAPKGPPAAVGGGNAGNGSAAAVGRAPSGNGFRVIVPTLGPSAAIGSAAPPAGAPSAPTAGGGLTAEVQFQPQNVIVRQLGDQTRMAVLGLDTLKGPAWSAAQVTGAPNTPQAGDCPTAWASATPDGQDEWLQVEFAEPAEAAAVLINETFNPGAVTAVQATSENGQILAVWKGADPVGRDCKKGLAIIPLSTPEKVHKITILIDSKSVPGWNEIDAVGLLDLQGVTHWATRATASSTFNAEYFSARVQLSRSLRTDFDVASGRDRVGQLEQQVQQLQQSLDEIKSLLKAQTAPTGGVGVPYAPQPGGGASLDFNSIDRGGPPAAAPPVVPTGQPSGTGPAPGTGALPKPSASGVSGAPAAGGGKVVPQEHFGIPFLERLFVPSVQSVPAPIPAAEAAPIRN